MTRSTSVFLRVIRPQRWLAAPLAIFLFTATALGAEQTIGIFGWSIHYETAAGYRYFSTHYGLRSVQEGEIVQVGQIIGTVGSWPGDPGRSHTHLGVTSPLGTADAKKRITTISQAVRV